MIVFVYDGSFEGLLTAIYEAYYNAEKPDRIYREQNYLQNLIDTRINIETDKSKFQKVYDAIITKISRQSLTYAFYAYLSDTEDADNIIYEYIRLGFRLGYSIDSYMHDMRVRKIQLLNHKVSREVQNMSGFLRFKLIGQNFYYAPMEPDHNIAALLAPHFTERLKDEKFIIHDLKRELAIIYNTKEWAVVPLTREKGHELADNLDDTIYEALWKDYFIATDIESRKNIKLQKRLMPQRYWKYLTEYTYGK